MIWVSWRQHRVQALMMLGVFAFIAIYALLLGLWLRSAYNSDSLGSCLARSGGADCGAAIESFLRQSRQGAMLPLTLVLFVSPGILGAAAGAPLLGQELERGTWQLAWSQTVPRTRWLVIKLGLVAAGLVAFGAAVTAVMSWAWRPLDLVGVRLQPPPFNFEGVSLTCSVLCGFGLALLAGLLLRNTIGALVAGYFAWEIPFLVSTLVAGPLNLLNSTAIVGCAGKSCAAASTNSTPPVTGHLGDLVTSVTRTGNQLVVSYLPAGDFWPLQFIVGGMYLSVALVAVGAAVWLLHRRTT